jgi:hypothetical protein
VAYLGRDAPYAERLLFEVPRAAPKTSLGARRSGAVLQQLAGRRKDAVTGGEEATDRRTRADARGAGWSRDLAKGVRPRQRGCGPRSAARLGGIFEGSRP